MRNVLTNLAAGVIATAALSSVSTVSAATLYDEGFETSAASWSSATRVPSGTAGVTSSSGSFHAQAANGAFTQFGGYNFGAGNNVGVPFTEYTTSIDIYLDPTATIANDTRFDFTSAISNGGGGHRRDFAINAGFYDDAGGPGSGTDRFVFSASNSTGRANSFPKNPGRGPVAVTETGWYTLTHEFRDNGLGFLEVEINLVDPTDDVAGTWTLSDLSDVINVTVGGSRYGWFPNSEFGTNLPIDNVSLVTVPEPAGLGLIALGGVMLLGRRGRRRPVLA